MPANPIVLSKPGYGTITVNPNDAGEWAWPVNPGEVVMTPEEWADAGWTPKEKS